jgi:glycogen debranching enzyme
LVQEAGRLAGPESARKTTANTYALALDGAKRPCRVRTSNAGHCLFAGIVGPERARRLARTLLGPESFSGWGVRTVAASEARYNPMAYHNGSVWPHDNALIAHGLGRYGLGDMALRVWTGLFEAGVGREEMGDADIDHLFTKAKQAARLVRARPLAIRLPRAG